MDGLLSFLLFAVFFFLMMRFGCGAHMLHGRHGRHSESTSRDIDPVCGSKVETEDGYGKMQDGTLYRFCSRKCLDTFDADSKYYLKVKEIQ